MAAHEGPRLVIFDLMGTTVVDSGQIAAAFRTTLADHGLMVTPIQMANVRGMNKPEAIARLIGVVGPQDQRARQIHADFQSRLVAAFRAEPPREIQGASQLFASIRDRSIHVALTTGLNRALVEPLLQALRWVDHTVVNTVVTGDDVGKGRPSPALIHRAMAAVGQRSAGRVAVVGDTDLDLEAGQRAGVRWNIGVLTGAHSRERLRRAPHTHLVTSVAALNNVWW